MLFRQNFVHQRHVPGSIETNHHSLSKIVGNCWKALPVPEKKHWEALADKKKEEHKRNYPEYRFQPKHDPEKKRKRQAARAAAEKAERERLELEREEQDLEREREFCGAGPDENARQRELEIEKDCAMAARRQQMRNAHNHLGHRRSSSVPLPTEAYSYPYSVYGNVPQADPFNFANPALAHAPSASGQNGIALPTLPSNLSGLVGSWYTGANENSNVPNGSTGLSLPNAGGQEGSAILALPSHLQHSQAPMTLSRAASPYTGVNTMDAMRMSGGFGGMAMNTLGMGTRAARQHQLGQLGRRASSTQPSLQHQLASGAFDNFHFGAGGTGSFPHPPFSGSHFDFNSLVQHQHQHQHQQQQNFAGFDGFRGAVAEGFTNPFASAGVSSSEDAPPSTGPDSVPNSMTTKYPAPLAPHTMWYDVESVDPMTPIGGGAPSPTSAPFHHQQHQHQQPTLPEVDTGLLNPAFNFGGVNDPSPASDVAEPHSPLSASLPPSASVPVTQVAHGGVFGFSSVHGAHGASAQDSAFGMGMRDSFDFSAFNDFFCGLPQNQRPQHANVNAHHAQVQAVSNDFGTTYASEGVPPHVVRTPPDVGSNFTLAQPVPVRKIVPPYVTEDASAGHAIPLAAHSFYTTEHHEGGHVKGFQEQYSSSQPSSSTGSSASASPSSTLAEVSGPHSSVAEMSGGVQQLGHDFVSGHELLDGPVDVAVDSSSNSNAPSQSQQSSSYGSAIANANADAGILGPGTMHGTNALSDSLGVPPLHMGLEMAMNYDGYARAPEPSAGSGDSSARGGAAEHDMNADPRFSFSDYVHTSPFLTPAVAH
ncbi:hypothetical protein DFH11DRAFT_1514776 [Phellopilus nigrolimitatus]|nr:hypothetical protein DFH11DRAFT_1514776 [Phellopilus nigrolimitatus]